MSIFASLVSQVLDQIPGAPGHSITIGKLSPKQLAAAAEAHQFAAIAQARKMREALGPELMESVSRVTPQEIAQVKADPLAGYDRVALMRAGIVSWTFDRPIEPGVLEDIDEDIQTYIAGAILRLSRPSLYRTAEEMEAEQKNG